MFFEQAGTLNVDLYENTGESYHLDKSSYLEIGDSLFKIINQ